MLNNLLLASVFALGIPHTAEARRAVPVLQSEIVFAIDQRLKADIDGMPEFHFELHADGSWSYVETVKQSIARRASGKLARHRVGQIRRLLRTSWTVTRAEMRCMAEAVTVQHFSIGPKIVWTEELCSGNILDRTSAEHLAKVMRIVDPLIAKAR